MTPARQILCVVLATLALAVAGSGRAEAQAAKLLAKHGDWETYAIAEKSGKVCYMASVPKKSQGAAKGRAATFVSITHRTADKSADVISVTGGYVFKKDSEVEIEAGGHKFKLFTSGDSAWARDAAADKTVLLAMTKAKEVIVRATPAKGDPTADTYSLNGFVAARAEIGKACGVK